MEYRTIKTLGETVSLLGFGAMRLPKDGPGEGDIDFDAAKAMLDEALADGVNYIDTAYVYHGGASESFLGKALAGRPRESYKLATKLPMYKVECAEDAEHIFNEQLERLQTDYIDFYLLHSLTSDSWQKVLDLDLYGFLARRKAEGKIRHLGFSFHDEPEYLEQFCSAFQWDFVQIQLNYLDWTLYKSKEQYEVLQKHGLPIIIMEPVRGGMLANVGGEALEPLQKARPGVSAASWAIRYAASFPEVMTVLSGMSTMAQVKDNVATLSPFEPLTGSDRAVLDVALTALKRTAAVPCTGCRYCMPCPGGVSIPDVFWTYNGSLLVGGEEAFQAQYRFMDDSEKPTNCTECGACESVCPQHLPIPRLLKEIDGGEKYGDIHV